MRVSVACLFVFSVTSALVIANNSEVSVVVPSVEVAAVLLTIALMRVLQVRAFMSIQLAPTLAAIAAEGRGRTFHQDPLFAFRLLADIALRALSPAVNDPATAVQVLDSIQGILSPLVTRDLDVADIADDSGAVRVVLALPSWDDYLRISLDDLIESDLRWCCYGSEPCSARCLIPPRRSAGHRSPGDSSAPRIS